MVLKGTFAIFGLISCFLLTTMSAAQAQIVSGYSYTLVCAGNGLALDNGDTTTQNSQVLQNTPLGSDLAQQWKITNLGNGYYTVVNTQSLDALDDGNSSSSGTAMVQWPAFANNLNQEWSIQSLGNGYYTLINRASGYALDSGSVTTSGGAAVQWTPTSGRANQKWSISTPFIQNAPLTGYIGVTCGWNYNNDLGGPDTGMANTPLFNPDPNNPTLTWDDWAEELGAAGVDFVCPNCRGSYPNTTVSSAYLTPLITALNNRGLQNRVKLALFDDNASSWTAQWNMANGRGFGGAQAFDISNSANWVYLWDYNYKVFFQTVPDANLFKINGRPVIIIWSGNPAFVGNAQGNESRALLYVRQQCQSTFGFNPYIIVGGDTLTYDTTCNNPSVVDATENWFGANTTGAPGWTMTDFNNLLIGAGCAQFQTAANNVWIDPANGSELAATLQNTAKTGAVLTLLEGFTDWEEDASLFRAMNITPGGASAGYSTTYYDYPNERLNIIRQYSRNPFPVDLKECVSGCDTFTGGAANSAHPNYYRNGNITVARTQDIGGGWDVENIQPNQSFTWQNVGIQGSPTIYVRVATTTANCRVHLVIDGATGLSITLPNTGGLQTWKTVSAGVYGPFASNSYHTVTLVAETGSMNLNFWELGGAIPDGWYSIIGRQSGLALDVVGQSTANGTKVDIWGYNAGQNQQWLVQSVGSYYTITGVQSGKLLDVVGASTTPGAGIDIWPYNNQTNQLWSIAPTGSGYCSITGVQSGDALEVGGQNTAPGSSIDIWPWNGGTNQQWSFNGL